MPGLVINVNSAETLLLWLPYKYANGCSRGLRIVSNSSMDTTHGSPKEARLSALLENFSPNSFVRASHQKLGFLTDVPRFQARIYIYIVPETHAYAACIAPR
jgi:hypothetical protein